MTFAARTGGWGADAKGLWEKLVDMAKDKGEEADLYGWHAMNWQHHWQQRIGVAIARKSADGDGDDGDNRTPDEGRSGGGETRRDAGVMPVHEWWTTGEESEKAEEDG